MTPPKRFDIFPPWLGDASEGLDALVSSDFVNEYRGCV